MAGSAARPVSVEMPKHIALIGNSLPRRCGLATFTSDTFDALAASYPDLTVDYYAMDDGQGVVYADEIRTIAQDDPTAYRAAARAIEESGAEAIWLQHEYGIFGGSAGEYILTLLDRTTLPVMVTLHTVLENPGVSERRVLEAIAARASKLIVMAEKGRALLKSVYGIADRQIAVIPHGVPDHPYVQAETMKPRFGFDGHKIILTFGLLAPDKGIEHMIAAMPAIVEAHPSALYVVLGATHPNLVRNQGEAYRDHLKAEAARLGVSDHIRFVDAFVEHDELLDYLRAADVYATPYLNPAQVTSGTLSYAIGIGKAVVATPYVHASEILADDHGVLVDFRDSAAMAQAIVTLLGDDEAREALSARAYARGRTMIWPQLATRAMTMLGAMKGKRQARIKPPRDSRTNLPVDISAVVRMSDATGMLQHSIYSVPDRRHGYCVDDNARALILMCRAEGIDEDERDRWTTVYGAFVQHAWNPDTQAFRNFMRFDRSWCEDTGSEDSQGRTLWALGVAARHARLAKHRDWASALFDDTAPSAFKLGSPRAQAFAMLGAAAMAEAHPGHALSREIMIAFGDVLVTLLAKVRRPDWSWFEAVLAYDNARLPEAMLRAGKALNRPDYIECGLDTLDWIVGQQTAPEGHFRAVGTDSFGRAFVPPLPFDQQPLEAQATIDACEAAFDASHDARWANEARTAYRWYLGANDLELPLSTREDGGCFDGLMPGGLNRNQGAESILALQLASAAIARLSANVKGLAETLDDVA